MKGALITRYRESHPHIKVLTPKNCTTVRLEFKGEKVAKAMGSLAAQGPTSGRVVSGMLIEKDFKHHLIAPQDLSSFTHLKTASVVQRQRVPFTQKFSLLDACLRQTYHDIEPKLRNDFYTLDVCSGSVFVIAEAPSIVVLEWNSNAVNDMLADSILAIMLQIEANPATNYIGTFSIDRLRERERERERESWSTNWIGVNSETSGSSTKAQRVEPGWTVAYDTVLASGCQSPQEARLVRG